EAVAEAREFVGGGDGQARRQRVEAYGERGGGEGGGDHSAAPISAASGAGGARRRANPATGATVRDWAGGVFTGSLMSFCGNVTVSPPPPVFDTSPMRLRSR